MNDTKGTDTIDGFTIAEWFGHHPPKTEARKAAHALIDSEIKILAGVLLSDRGGDTKEAASCRATAMLSGLDCVDLAWDWAVEQMNVAGGAMYESQGKYLTQQVIAGLTRARQHLHQGVALAEVRRLRGSNPEEVELRGQVSLDDPNRETIEVLKEKNRILKSRVQFLVAALSKAHFSSAAWENLSREMAND